MDTLLLDRTTWDVLTDAAGNIAKASEPYAIAQDVASAIRLFKTELWYNRKKGIPYFQKILGKQPPLPFFKAQVVKAALSVPEVASARCIIASFSNRQLTGQVQVIDKTGQSHNVQF